MAESEERRTSYSQINTNLVKYANVFELVESNQVIADIYSKMTGREKSPDIDGTLKWRRIKKPDFTDEFAYNIGARLMRTYSNPVTAQSTFSIEPINNHLNDSFESLIETFSLDGGDHYVSEKNWREMLRLANMWVLDDKGRRVSNKFTEPLGMTWTPDEFISLSLLKFVKRIQREIDYKAYSLIEPDSDEQTEQANNLTQYSQWWRDIFVFCDASLRRSLVSKPGITLQYQGQVMTQTNVDRTEPKGMAGIPRREVT